MSKSHSVHNENLCRLLLKDGSYNDWVITSAFYSALQLVYHQLFPLTAGTQSYNSFNNYYANEISRKKKSISKHKATVQLVAMHLGTCYSSYKWLHDNCFLARYNNYQIKITAANYAVQQLEKVKSACTKP